MSRGANLNVQNNYLNVVYSIFNEFSIFKYIIHQAETHGIQLNIKLNSSEEALQDCKSTLQEEELQSACCRIQLNNLEQKCESLIQDVSNKSKFSGICLAPLPMACTESAAQTWKDSLFSCNWDTIGGGEGILCYIFLLYFIIVCFLFDFIIIYFLCYYIHL